ncbi:MAG: hypothetical protein WBX25_21670 [Rhodomicrobium sp.]
MFNFFSNPSEGSPKTFIEVRDQQVNESIKQYVADAYQTVLSILRDHQDLKQYLGEEIENDLNLIASKYFRNPLGRKSNRPKGSIDKRVKRAINDLIARDDASPRKLTSAIIRRLRSEHHELFKRKTDDAINIAIRRVRKERASRGGIRATAVISIGVVKGTCRKCDNVCEIPMDYGAYEYLLFGYRCGVCGERLTIRLPAYLCGE